MTVRIERSAPLPARRGVVRYADPAAWLVLDAIAEAAPAVPGAAVGLIGVSEHATLHTLRRCAADRAADPAALSPLRFVAASPGTLVGLAAVHLGYTGPSLLLTMPPALGRPVAVTIAQEWLRAGPPAARAVAVATYEVSADGTHVAECTWLGEGR
ncbi:hypothetical protein KZZ52_26225 [Dactylosporangium sp. AC04546]|uniref:hypothetical protein n=1 Tax=Dactylosporangium sp. AC04546 TaxID=2862460 RepID=UPI001EDD53EE|nr:hypothetical protein [Dactylosporangium sp. AC04546]WVK88769.1 hypothetical protein KZZ52_26225 [Dactylosporangium sp. AC04546]